MAKAQQTAPAPEVEVADPAAPMGVAGLYPLFIPIDTYKALSDAAFARGMTFAQLFSQALNTYLASTAPDIEKRK